MNQSQPDLDEAKFGHYCVRIRLGVTQIASSAISQGDPAYDRNGRILTLLILLFSTSESRGGATVNYLGIARLPGLNARTI